MTQKVVRLPDGRVWLRVAEPHWADPLDPSYAQHQGGRWNAPGTHATLYLNGDVATARLQLERLLDGEPFTIDDLRGDAYLLIAAVLPDDQVAADAASRSGLAALGLPASYPLDEEGREIPHATCQRIGGAMQEQTDGVWCRSACTGDGRGRELAWFPGEQDRARPVWEEARPLSEWRYADQWGDLGLEEQPVPFPAT